MPLPTQFVIACFEQCSCIDSCCLNGLNTLLQMQGIMVRHYAKPELSGFIRISAGRPDQTDLLMKAIHAL